MSDHKDTRTRLEDLRFKLEQVVCDLNDIKRDVEYIRCILNAEESLLRTVPVPFDITPVTDQTKNK